VDAVNPSAEVESTMSASASTPARASRSRTGSPSQRALPIRDPPTSFDTHASVTSDSCIGIASNSSQVISISRSTIPWMRNDQSAGSTRGTMSAVSMR